MKTTIEISQDDVQRFINLVQRDVKFIEHSEQAENLKKDIEAYLYMIANEAFELGKNSRV